MNSVWQLILPLAEMASLTMLLTFSSNMIFSILLTLTGNTPVVGVIREMPPVLKMVQTLR